MRNRVLLFFAVCGLLCASVGWPQTATSRASSKADPPIARKRNVKGVPNFGEVTEKLYRGGQPTAEGFERLAHEGVVVVVDLHSSRSEREIVTKLGMEYVSIPWHCYHPQDKQVAEFLRLIREHPDKKVFVHCRLGEDRTGMMIAGYRIAEQGWTATQARKEMTAFGFSSVHQVMCPGLATYEENFPREFRSSPAFDGLRPPAAQTRPQ